MFARMGNSLRRWSIQELFSEGSWEKRWARAKTIFIWWWCYCCYLQPFLSSLFFFVVVFSHFPSEMRWCSSHDLIEFGRRVASRHVNPVMCVDVVRRQHPALQERCRAYFVFLFFFFSYNFFLDSWRQTLFDCILFSIQTNFTFVATCYLPWTNVGPFS